LQLISPIYFFANSWFLSDSEDTEERYGVVECHGKDSRIHVPHCFTYFFGAKPFPNEERKQKKSMETMGQERVFEKNKPGGTCGIGVIFLRI